MSMNRILPYHEKVKRIRNYQAINYGAYVHMILA